MEIVDISIFYSEKRHAGSGERSLADFYLWHKFRDICSTNIKNVGQHEVIEERKRGLKLCKITLMY